MLDTGSSWEQHVSNYANFLPSKDKTDHFLFRFVSLNIKSEIGFSLSAIIFKPKSSSRHQVQAKILLMSNTKK